MVSCSRGTEGGPQSIKVEVAKTDSGYQLLRGGEPYAIRGVGMDIDDIDTFAAHGGNSIRNWSTDNDYQDTQDLLDSAYEHGVSVALCLPMQAERWGFDYDDAAAVAAQHAAMREEVLKYRDHPALLLWIIGNELNHGYSNSKVYDAVNDVARMIHELDPNHPTTTTVEGIKKRAIDDIQTRAPDLDFISFQTYGELFALPDRLDELDFHKPFMVTEWGAIGYWEMDKTSWGAPTEMTSSEKADVFLRGHREILATLEGQLIGSYAFLWGQKQERTPTWFGMFTEQGEETEVVDVMHYVWNGTWPANRTPRVNSLRLDGKSYKDSVRLAPAGEYAATFDVIDRDGDPLSYRWEIKPESKATQVGGDFEDSLASLQGLIVNPTEAAVTMIAPGPGEYRLFAYAYDGNGHAAHANIPFLVSPGSEK